VREIKSSPPILVTGGAGYIGSYVNRLLNQHGYDTMVLDDLSRRDEALVRSGRLINSWPF